MALVMETSLKTAVVVPTYNESDNIGILAQEILSLPVQLVIVDDNSPDGTGEIADEWARKDSRVFVLHRPRKMGLGTAYIAGFKRALSLGADQVITMDADFSHHPRYIPALLTRSETADLVIGSRYVDAGGTLNCTLARRALSRSANIFARIALGLRAHDCTAGFRCYRREVLESIDLDTIFSDGYSFLIEMLYRSQKMGHKIEEVPIIFEDRRRGASKISRGEILKALYTVIRLSLTSK
ncbi:MAG: polyprenol monophosphomannose synthase [Anaerolineae bacterium]